MPVKETVREQVPVQQFEKMVEVPVVVEIENIVEKQKIVELETIVPQLVKVHEVIKDKIMEVPLRNHKGSSN